MNRTPEIAADPDVAGYHVDDLFIDLGLQRVTRGDAEIPLPALSFDLLLALVRAAPNVLTYDQLMERVWPGVVVNPETITQRIKLVRDALGDDPRKPRYIARVRGRGYRMLASNTPVTKVGQTDGQSFPSASLQAIQTTNATSRRPWRLIAAAVGGMMLLLGAGAVVVNGVRQRNPPAPERTAVVVQPVGTIAVLPFANLSGDPENEYFSDGLTEELLNRLTMLHELHVAARTSSFYFKDKTEDVKRIGEMLGVRHVLEGSVRKEGDRVRVSAQLVSTENGYRVWANAFDRRVADVFAIQDEIALAVVENLKLTLVAEQRAALTQDRTSNPAALDLYLRARRLYQSFELERMDKAIGYFEDAIRLDPAFAAAYVGLAAALGWRWRLVGARPGDARLGRIPSLLHKALELDPGNADAHALLGVQLQFAYDFEGAERELLQAERLNPNAEQVLEGLLGHYATVGWPPEKAVGYARKARQIDPLNPWAVIHVAQAHWHAHQYDEALRELEPVREIDPNFWLLHGWEALVLFELHRYDEAISAAQRAIELYKDADTASILVRAYAKKGDLDRAREYAQRLESGGSPNWSMRLAFKDYEGALSVLEQMYTDRDPWLPEFMHYPEMLPLHGEPRFQRLARLTGQERRVEHTARKHREALVDNRAGR